MDAVGQMELFVQVPGSTVVVPSRTSRERPRVGLRAYNYMDGTIPKGYLLLCGSDLDQYISILRKMRSPAWSVEYVEGPADCRVETKVAREGGWRLGEIQGVLEKLRALGVPVELDQPGDPQVDGPLIWGSPNSYGEIRTERVAPRGGYYVIVPTAGGLWSAHFNAGGTYPVLLTVDPEDDMVGHALCPTREVCKRLVERDWERSNQRTGFVYEDWQRGDTVVKRGLVRWKGKGKMPPLPVRIFADLLLSSTPDNARAQAAESRPNVLIAPSVSVRATPVRVYEWDVDKDARLERPYFEGSDAIGAYALSPEGSKGLLTRWAKNL